MRGSLSVKKLPIVALAVVLLGTSLLLINSAELRAQPPQGSGQEIPADLAQCLLQAGTDTDKQKDCLKNTGLKFLDKALQDLPPEYSGCLQAYVDAGIDLGSKSVAEQYQGHPGQAIGFLWDKFGSCLKDRLPGLAFAQEIIKAIKPSPPNSLLWIPIPDPFDGLTDLINVLLKRPQRTAQILDENHNPITVKASLPFSHEWGKEFILPAPGCLVPEFVFVQPNELLAPTHGDLRTSIFPNGTINLILPRFVKFWNIGPAIIGCFWLYNFMFTVYEVRYEVLTGNEFNSDGKLIERITCRKDSSCQFFKKGTSQDITIRPMTQQRSDGIYRLDSLRLDGVAQSVGSSPFTITLDMSRPHELIYVWKRLSADLVIDDILLKPKPTTPSLQQGQEFDLFVRVKNIGELSALQADRRSPLSGATEVRVRASGIAGTGKGTITGELCDQPLRDCSLKPGESREIQVYDFQPGILLPFPWVAPFASAMTLRTTIDPNDVIDEGGPGEKNNTLFRTITLANPTLPDPAFIGKNPVGFKQVGATTLRLGATVTNLSPVAASNVVVRFDFTDLPPPVGGGVLESTISTLPGKKARLVEMDWDVCKAPVGFYVIGVGIDPMHQIPELNENNNNTGLRVIVSASLHKAKVTTDKPAYLAGEIVTISFFNGCAQKIVLRNSAPWVIKDSQRQIVFAPAALGVITEVQPGETKHWAWNQKNQTGSQIPAGAYTVELETMDAGTYRVGFAIQSLLAHIATTRVPLLVVSNEAAIHITVVLFDLSGRRILAQEVEGSQLQLYAEDASNRRLANGIYLAVITVKDLKGEIHYEVRKLIVSH